MTMLVGDLTYIFTILAGIIMLLDSAMFLALSGKGEDFSVGLVGIIHLIIALAILLGLIFTF